RKGKPLDQSLIRKPYLELAHFSVEKPAQFRAKTNSRAQKPVKGSMEQQNGGLRRVVRLVLSARWLAIVLRLQLTTQIAHRNRCPIKQTEEQAQMIERPEDKVTFVMQGGRMNGGNMHLLAHQPMHDQAQPAAIGFQRPDIIIQTLSRPLEPIHRRGFALAVHILHDAATVFTARIRESPAEPGLGNLTDA
ncbi:hypothetical protein, partial [Agrobacterium vitis]